MSSNILICLTDGVEDIEAVTVMDLLNRANIATQSTNVTTKNTLTLTCAYGTKITTDTNLHSVINQNFNAIILPGGLKAAQTYRDTPILIEKIKEMHNNGKIIGAICAAPALVLEYHNLFPTSKITCYPTLQNKIPKEKIINLPVYYDKNTKLLTGQGPAASFDFALKLIEILSDQNTAKKIASQLLLPWNI